MATDRNIVTSVDLVPQDHLLRIIDKAIDWLFIYELVRDTYSDGMGRPSIDPVTLLTLPKSGHVKSVMIDEVFSDPERLAESLVRNWCWQWFYENRRSVKEKDYDDIRTLDNDVPAALKEQYFQRLQEL